MADPNVTVERYEDGVLVDTQTFAKPVDQFNRETIEERAIAALANNAAFIDLASPTNAQAVAQVKDLSRQVNGIIRILLNRLESAD
jgi:hypothetical protein